MPFTIWQKITSLNPTHRRVEMRLNREERAKTVVVEHIVVRADPKPQEAKNIINISHLI